jgi:Papain-like cysteine protease AvrRpt2
MVYHITKIVNNSPKTAVLTNPVAARDRHVVTKHSWTIPPHPPKIEIIKDSNVTYPTAMKKTLNIYTGKNNWCFWDNGVSGSGSGLIGIGEGGDRFLFPTPPNTPKLVLNVSNDGTPSFSAEDQRYLPIKVETQERINWCWAAAAVSISNYYTNTQKWRQCELANLTFNRKDCCSGLRCNSQSSFWGALERTGNASSLVQGPIALDQIIWAIDRGEPIAVVLTSGIGNHGVIITGYNNHDPKRPTIKVQDPDPVGWTVICDFNTFPKSFSLRYGWGETDFTKASE